jgi:hypothetical protein
VGKKKKRQSTKYAGRSKQKAPSRKKKFNFLLIALAFGAGLLIAGVYFFYQGETRKVETPERPTLKKENISLRERRPTLSPEMFTGRIWKAYRVAREIPEVLDGLYCYCRCRENFGHKGLLSCFVDKHAST